MIVRLVTWIPLALVALGLASHSAFPAFLGKSRSLWAAIAALAVLQAVVVFVFRRLAPATRAEMVLMLIVFAGTFEVAAFACARWLPIALLLQTPDWVTRTLPERALERADYRVLGAGELLDDPELGFRHAAHLDVVLQQRGIRHHQITDAHGFANVDDSLYRSADVVVTGDSLTMGYGVEVDASWPQWLSRLSGNRVLNVSAGGWDVYQYPLVIARYAPPAAPKVIVVGLTAMNDLATRFYRYEDYRREHPDVAGYRQFVRRAHPWGQWADVNGNYLRGATQIARIVLPFTMTSAVFLFNVAIAPSEVCRFSLGGKDLAASFELPQWKTGVSMPDDWVIDSPYASRVARDFAAIARTARRIGAAVCFVYLPMPEEIYLPLLQAAKGRDACARSAHDSYTRGAYDFDKAVRTYTSALGGLDVTFVNLTKPLQSHAARGEQLVVERDWHPNALGYRRIAEAIVALRVLPTRK